jgi:hypothetical protein
MMQIKKQRKKIDPLEQYDKETTMTYKIESSKRTQVDAGYETSKFTLGVGMTMAALVGLWGTACLISALAGTGPINLVKSYFSAMLG